MKVLALLLFSILVGITACKNTDTNADYVPNVPVRVDVILTNIEAQPLNIFPNYIYLKGGYKGIMLYKTQAGEYIAFDRCCSYRPMDTCAKVSVHSSNLYLVDPCCKSQFDFEGNVTIGPAFRPLRYYSVTYLAPNQIRISN